ncbi:glutamate--cysteine ligase [Lyngbya confervoides]|uniref:Glutamate--cysteine ligase n=1 Tax=Lyngbya confervoides BDU141951 TaxID=1574623 RepID=A0ABD4T6D4_9CYAN|nr:glutamate--cysteine ligase [Lyngbya confervoides]MCM1984196.1 glutamate--cysteine ligase [Lyngbya confervoides BDU141951]
MLLKGFEVEVYTGTPLGKIVGLSHFISQDLAGFVKEPDSRNVEYVTAPTRHYAQALCDLVTPRMRLRHYLRGLGDYSIIPGSTLSLGDSRQFYRSDPTHPYHSYIESTYGTRVVTASVHINIGIEDPEILMRACRLVRMEAPLLLALSASSPFLDGGATGYHSTRWASFPKTPEQVPLFESHQHFIDWTNAQLASGSMQNVRHLWSSVRPNGNQRPYDLNRLELRICDLVASPIHLLAITALLEARIQMILDNPDLDPLLANGLGYDGFQLASLADQNEAQVARHSLEAELIHWQSGQPILARDWIQDLYDQVWPLAKTKGYSCFLSPILEILREGNQAQQWLRLHQEGYAPQSILIQAIATMVQQELEVRDKLCEPVAL